MAWSSELWPSPLAESESYGRITLAESEWHGQVNFGRLRECYGRVTLADSEKYFDRVTLAESENAWSRHMPWLLQSEISLTNQPRLVRGASGASAHARRG